MMFFKMLLLAAMGLQTASVDIGHSESQVRTDALMQRAWLGRRTALARVCADSARIKRVQKLDVQFGRIQRTYRQRFGSIWNGQAVLGERRTDPHQILRNGVFTNKRDSEVRCASSAAFAGALGEYQNGIVLAEVELGISSM